MKTSSLNLYDASVQWATRPQDERFQTLAQLREAVQCRRLRSRSMDVDVKNVKVGLNPDGLLTVNGTITPSEPTHWSFAQLAQQAKAPAGYLRSLPKPLVVDCLNHGITMASNASVKFMTVERENGINTLQAVTSPTYGRIWDADVVDAVQRIVDNSGGRFSNPLAYAKGGCEIERAGLYASDRDVFIFMIDGGSRLEVNDRAKLHRGFITWNSETGSKTFGLMTFLFNEVCGNHIIWGARDVNKLLIRHTSNGPWRFDADAIPALNAYCEAGDFAEIAVIKRASENILLPNGTRDELSEWLNRQGKFTKSEVTGCYDFAKAEEGDCKTLWHVVQGLTAYARGYDYVDARVDLEKRAGKLLELIA